MFWWKYSDVQITLYFWCIFNNLQDQNLAKKESRNRESAVKTSRIRTISVKQYANKWLSSSCFLTRYRCGGSIQRSDACADTGVSAYRKFAIYNSPTQNKRLRIDARVCKMHLNSTYFSCAWHSSGRFIGRGSITMVKRLTRGYVWAGETLDRLSLYWVDLFICIRPAHLHLFLTPTRSDQHFS